MAQRHIDETLAAQVIIVAQTKGATIIKFLEFGFFADDIDRAAIRVAAKEGALWPSEHLDPFHIDKPGQRLRVPWPVKAIRIKGHRDIISLHLRGDRASHGKPHIVPGLLKYQARNHDIQPADIIDAIINQHVAAHRGDRDRDILQALFAFLGRHDNLFLLKGFRGQGLYKKDG